MQAMQAKFDVSFRNNFHGEFVRSQKAVGQKNLRCFPYCRGGEVSMSLYFQCLFVCLCVCILLNVIMKCSKYQLK